MRHVVPQINVTSVRHAAHHVVALVHATPKAVDERLWWLDELAEKRMALHPLRRFHAGEATHRRCKIHKAHEPFRLAAGSVFGRAKFLELFRDVNHERHL